MIPLLLFLQTALIPAAISVRDGSRVNSVSIVSAPAGHAFVRADDLVRALGGTLSPGVNGRYTISLPHVRIEVLEAIAFVRADSVVVPVADAPKVIGGRLLLPFQLVSEILPRFGGGLFYDADMRELRTFSAATISRRAPPRDAAEPPRPVAAAPAQSTRARRTMGTRRLVVVDAGHGGPDRGMSGPIGGDIWFLEKNVTLAVARRLTDALRAQGLEVMMTRSTDTLIALSDRGRIANRNKGDLFVSIHVNAPGSSNAAGARERGFETYFLAEAKTEDERRVERMENESVRFETGANAPKGDPLSFIITDMAQNEHLRESSDLAETIQQGLRKIHPGPSRGVQQANFAVLRGSYMPAVLVEIGFGSNASEASYLSDPDNQTSIARNISESVLDYLDHYQSRIGGVR